MNEHDDQGQPEDAPLGESRITPAIARVLQELRDLKADWWLTPHGKVRARGSNLDPLCELARKKLRRPSRLHQFMSAGRDLGLSDSETLDIAVASDNYHGDYDVALELRAAINSLIK